MLKLDQIVIQNEDDIIIEMLEPVVYTHAGTQLKTDETMAREKSQVYYTVAKVVKVKEAFKPIQTVDIMNKEILYNPDVILTTDIGLNSEENIPTFTVRHGDYIIIPRKSVFPIQFPIEGYDSPKLAVISKYMIFAGIIDEKEINKLSKEIQNVNSENNNTNNILH